MWKFLYLLTLPLFFLPGANSKPNIPKNLIENHIKHNANFSVDPCDDFFAHVCPKTSTNNFMKSLTVMRNKIIKRYKAEHTDEYLDEFSLTKTKTFSRDIRRLLKRDYLKNLCEQNDELMMLFIKHSVESGPYGNLEKWKQLSCDEKVENIKNHPDPIANFPFSREELRVALDASIANFQLKSEDRKLRKLFKKLKFAVSKQLKKTPWAIKNGAVEMYQNALQKINFTTFADMQELTQNALRKHKSFRTSCIDLLYGKFPEDVQSAICEVIAVGEGSQVLNALSDKLDETERMGIMTDVLQMFNTNDNRVYIGNDFMLLAKTNHLSDLYGGIAFSLTHEIMHTLVFDYIDVNEQKPLIPFWTKDAGCVEEQTRKTCQTFPTVTSFDGSNPFCNSTITFEEDAADIAAYRIVNDIYQKAYSRKTPVANYESLNKRQLFFYGAAVLFCHPDGMEPVMFSGNPHSNNYQRVNSLMSQMDQFAEAFQCKPTDKMMMNKGRHCELYGSKAEIKK